MLAFLAAQLFLAYLAYSFSGTWLLTMRCHGLPTADSWRLTIWQWTKWPALAYVILNPIQDIMTGQTGVFDALLSGLAAVMWWELRNAGDDDLKKKLKKFLKETVAQIEGKLVVVPAVAR